MIKYLIMDVDGTLTDGKIYMGNEGEVIKGFSVKDGYAFKYILEPAKINPIIITARTSKIVANRCEELGIKDIYQGKTDKVSVLKEILGENSYDECAYFGDDMLDIRCMNIIKKTGGIVGCPADAVREVKALADYICVNRAGEGALREFAEWLVWNFKNKNNRNERISEAIKFIKELKIENIKTGKYIVNDSFYYLVQSYSSSDVVEYGMESHRKYIDIQFIVKGYERMAVTDIARLIIKENYDEEEDRTIWEIPQKSVDFTLREGDHIILYPENAHRIIKASEEPVDIIKIVGKVKC